MDESIDALIVDLLNWIGPSSRPYAEVIDAWRTSCPKLPIWEDATDRGFIQQLDGQVVVTGLGREFVRSRRDNS